jgi:hypothetical protein
MSKPLEVVDIPNITLSDDNAYTIGMDCGKWAIFGIAANQHLSPLRQNAIMNH